MEIVIGIGEYFISNREDDVIKTYGLGSCVAVSMYSPARRVLGLVHIALPNSKTAGSVAVNRPGHYVDTAIPLLFHKLEGKYNCLMGELVVNVYGGADSTLRGDVFQIGRKNVEAVKNKLAKYHISPREVDTGGNVGRNIEAYVATGEIRL
ncbi:MAG: chemotaxis protein CheD, partial [Clostridiales bacterium]|nr:chemotaxis protein CheD [Clostridiales bacterium]